MRRIIFKFAISLLATVVVSESMAQVPLSSGRVGYVESMLERGRWGEARVALNRLGRELDPIVDAGTVEWVEYHKMRCAVELGAADADIMMESFIEQYPWSIYRNSVMFMLATETCDRGDYQTAGELFAAVDYKGLNTEERERYDIRVGYIHFNNNDYATALQHFLKIGKLSKYYPHALYHRAYIAYREGRNVEAAAGFEELGTYDIYCDLAPYYLLQIEYRKGNYDAVIEGGQRLLSSASAETYVDLVRILAESYFIKGDYANAIRYMANYPASKFDRQTYYIKGYSLYRMARYRDAVESLYNVCGAEDALTQNAAFHLGDCYLRLGDKKQAAEAFGMASVEGFDEEIAEDAMLNYCRLMYELGGGIFNESINILKEYLLRYPDSIYEGEIKQLLIAAYYNSEDYDAAYVAIHEFKNPDKELRSVLQRVAVFRAVDAIEREDWDMAWRLLSEADAIGLVAKYNALALYWQGEVAYHTGDMERAIERYEDYVRRAPKSEIEYHYAHYGMGYAYFAQGNMAEARDAFEEFVRDYTKRDAYLYDAHNRLGDAYFSTREFSDARRVYKVSAASAYDERYYAEYQLAMVDGIDNKTKNKIDRLKGIVSAANGDYVDDAWYELGRTYLAQERYRDGANTLQEFVDSDPTSPYYVGALSDLALAYYNMGRKSDARECYEKVVEADPQSSSALEAMRGIREIYVSEGRIDDYFAYAERSGVQSDMSIAARDSLTFAAAKSVYLDGNVELASRKLGEYLDDFDKGYNRTEALFYLSDCYVIMEKNAEALDAMEQLLALGSTQYTERVLDVYARMSYDEEKFKESAEAYFQLYNTAHNQKRRAVASEGYVDAMLHYASGDEVLAMAEVVDDMKDATEWARRQTMRAKADVLREKGNRNDAMAIYAMLAENTMTEEGAEAYYRLVEDSYLQGNYSDVEKRVYNLGQCGSMFWQAKMFLVLGDVLAKSGNTFQARATYQSIVDGYTPKDDGIVEEAKKRIASLAK